MSKCLCGNEKQNGAWICDKCIVEEEIIIKDFNIFMNLQERLNKCAKDENNQPLICYGCSHSAAYCLHNNGELVEGTDFPGRPSGERPCFFCIRNITREEWQEDFTKMQGERLEVWYDGSFPVKVPMDCYHSVDMIEQINLWCDD